MKTTYSELLKDPRWQKKRLEIFQRDNFTCRACDFGNRTLHIHHTTYDKDLLPWEYENDDLITLCEDCHKIITIIEKALKYTKYDWNYVKMVADLLDRLEQEDIERYYRKQEKEGKIIEPTGGKFYL